MADKTPPDGFQVVDPGPDLQKPPPVPPRTPEESMPARQALRNLSDTLGKFADLEIRVDARLAFLHSVMPLSTPEEVGDALAFAGRVLSHARVRLPDDLEVMPEVCTWRRVAVHAVNCLCALVDGMRRDLADQGSTDRRRSVDPFDSEFAALASRLSPEAQARVLAYARLEAAGPVDREALGRAARAAHPKSNQETFDRVWAELPEGVRESWRKIGEHLYRMGQAAGDARLREAAEDVVCSSQDDAPTSTPLRCAIDSLADILADTRPTF